MKAYFCEEESTGYGFIEWFETRGQAKAHFANEFQLRFTDVHPIRIPWADPYRSVEEIPVEVVFENGWHYDCTVCGNRICSIDNLFDDEHGFCCKRCFLESR